MTVTKSWLNEEVPDHQKGFRFKISVKKESISRKFEFSGKIKGCQRELAAMMRGSNMGILPYWLILYVTWGLLVQT